MSSNGSSIVNFEGTLLLYRDDFTPQFTNAGCGSTEPCAIHTGPEGCTCLRIGNHATWIFGCGARWTSKDIEIRELVEKAIGNAVKRVVTFSIDSIDISSYIEAGWGALVHAADAKMKIYADGMHVSEFGIALPINPPEGDYKRNYRLNLDLSGKKWLRIEVDESLRAASGYVLMHVHDIVVHFSGTAEVNIGQINKGTVQVDVVDDAGNPVSGAVVTISGPLYQNRKSTDSEGKVIFEDVPYGTYKLIVRKSGYRPVETSIIVDKAWNEYKVSMLMVYGPGFSLDWKMIAIAGVAVIGIFAIAKLLRG